VTEAVFRPILLKLRLEMGGEIDWQRINAALPYQKGEQQHEERR
jgi:hypothetical protein